MCTSLPNPYPNLHPNLHPSLHPKLDLDNLDLHHDSNLIDPSDPSLIVINASITA